jgi:hypothetical protein
MRRRADVLALDKGQVFATPLIEIIQAVGSAQSNEYWEASLDPLLKIKCVLFHTK